MLLPFAPVAGLLAVGGIVLAAFFFADPAGFFDSFRFAPGLPSWAYPEGDLVDHYSGCGGNADDLPPCRTIVFGANDSFSSIGDELEQRFATRHWTVRRGPGDLLSATSPKNDVCVLYIALSRDKEAANAAK